MRLGVFSTGMLRKLKKREEEIKAGKALTLRNRPESNGEASDKRKKNTRAA